MLRKVVVYEPPTLGEGGRFSLVTRGPSDWGFDAMWYSLIPS
ncbi:MULTISPECIES: hypothetical protein [Actinomadura]|uniref:Lasso RiPP family leader peptide-containing protein n=1 Tax=Actinomadura miaoliensis TaxID=430685 RepID=A0ABP7WDQ3_9ACTN